MPNDDSKLFNFETELKKKMPLVIETFISFYGEDKADIIKQKINDTLVIVTCSFNILMKRIENEIDSYCEGLARSFFDEIEMDNKSKEKYYFFLRTLFNRKVMEGNSVSNKLLVIKNFMDSGIDDEDLVTFLSFFRPEINEDNYLDIRNDSKYIDYFNKIMLLYQKYNDEYHKYLQKKFKVIDYLNEENTNRKIAEDKAMRRLIKNVVERFPDKIKKQITADDYNYLKGKASIKRDSVLYKLFFKEKNNDPVIEWLNDSNVIMKNYQDSMVDFIRTYLEIDLGNKYESYLDNEEVQELINALNSIKIYYDKMYKKFLNLYYLKGTKEAKRIAKQCINNDNIDEVVELSMEKEFTNVGLLNFNINNGEDLRSVVLFELAHKSFNDIAIFHEFNHRIELDAILTENGEYEYYCGWKNAKNNKLDIDDELLDEVVNDLISRDIAILAHQKGIVLFSSDLEDNSYYTIGFPIVEDFYNIYKEQIIESRLSHNMESLYELIGRENFIELIKLLNDYVKNFSYIVSSKDLEKYLLDASTKWEYDEFMAKKKIILDNMKNYNNGKVKRLKKGL